MEEHIISQFWCILNAVATGMLISAIYDIFRILRIAIKHKSFLVFFEDIIFSLLSLIITLIFFSTFNSGVFRVYLSVSIIGGFFLWHYSAGALLIYQARVITRIIKYILRIIFTPIRLILLLICKFLKKIKLF